MLYTAYLLRPYALLRSPLSSAPRPMTRKLSSTERNLNAQARSDAAESRKKFVKCQTLKRAFEATNARADACKKDLLKLVRDGAPMAKVDKCSGRLWDLEVKVLAAKRELHAHVDGVLGPPRAQNPYEERALLNDLTRRVL